MNELRLLRYVPVDSPIHRMWAGTKLLVLGALSIALTVKPTFEAEGVLLVVIIGGYLLSRVPRSVFPRPPRWFLIGFAIYGGATVLAGGPPRVRIGETVLELGGFLDSVRFVGITVLFAFGAAVVGWTTRLADLGPAVRTLGTPLRLVRVPVDEIAVAIGLAVRCLPLMADEVRTLDAARRMRRPQVPSGLRARVRDIHDLLVTALVAAVRRAREMAEAIDARGGHGTIPRGRVRLGFVDVIALAVGAAAVAAVVVL